MQRPWVRLKKYLERNSAKACFHRYVPIRLDRPIISFTFDDFPRTALWNGGAILEAYGVTGTYYAAFGLMGKDSPSGRIFEEGDLEKLFTLGHELGCHTFAHCHSWETDTEEFRKSIELNRSALNRYLPQARFRSFSYPISEPRPWTKRVVSGYFECCRAGGQAPNTQKADLNQLSAYFLERAPDGLQSVKNVIDRNRDARGWTIFATHDVAEHPSAYGCTPGFFDSVVSYAVRSGALILSVAEACRLVRSTGLPARKGMTVPELN